MSVEKSLLGKDTDYPTQYQPNILFPITRAPTRQNYQDIPYIEHGTDWWHVFELSWLNTHNVPQVAIGRLSIPATSACLIESKSLKLYFNSLNFTMFSSQAQLIETVQQDLSTAAQAPIVLELIDVNGLTVSQPTGQCIDHLTPSKHSKHPDASLLRLDTNESHIVEEQLHCNLLRSNCPVTGQPDWGTLFIRYEGKKIDHASLLAYIISFREHNGFHEQCVEQIFAEIWQTLQPKQLMVYAAYTRRGGLDINPCRSSNPQWLPNVPLRLARQ
ncbi:NADPH-dependent 7-cyano-7-deazaguanine reductase QueF [Acinetobacter rathckeae]|uniref:NADPH-dependent 7-cyano-7-deazaguanine reductase QueF n=1 Tax=Acinetobacter rathckeae TaxID=2605272 RepID=UPI0018A28817|nr:NADPH-dependent 7-cyano-7-deazaguanine reductase QueF [Acinetobacter rathckeae]MBF7687438.1 NADPH-dependent 7-cyano-7-deazaguanine reductase QueF [Acinetobacter rathckeae]MBF7694839.1 NADPH-dependent 7-cyano-7-deazaguanine reductase QueF [Acinetobacter rathckeae]